MNGSVTKVLLADDHKVLRTGLRLLLERQDDYKIVGEASTGLAALSLAEKLQPDLILLDLSMPGLGGLEAIQALRKLAPESKILVLTMHEDPLYLHSSLKFGAVGYIVKKAADVELLTAMQSVIRGDVYVDPSMTRYLLEDVIASPNSGDQKDSWDTLSNREQEVLRLVALGHTSAETAETLGLSPKTVETYRARGMEKLNLQTRAALVRYALQHGKLSIE